MVDERERDAVQVAAVWLDDVGQALDELLEGTKSLKSSSVDTMVSDQKTGTDSL